MSLTHVKKRYSGIRIFIFIFSKAEQYTSGRVQNVVVWQPEGSTMFWLIKFFSLQILDAWSPHNNT